MVEQVILSTKFKNACYERLASMAGEWTSTRSAIIKPGVGGKSLKIAKTEIASLSIFVVFRKALTKVLTTQSFHSLTFCEVKT